MIQDKSKEQRGKFLQLMFQDYYREHPDDIDIPDRIWTREFGLESWDYFWKCTNPSCGQEGTSFRRPQTCPKCNKEVNATKWRRHIGFRTGEALMKELLSSAPHSVYHSAAFYETPVARMDEKGWQGAELVFDIDADHLNAPCADDHDSWMCNNPSCKETGTGLPPTDGCPRCGQVSFSTRKWVCNRCLEDAKRNTIKIFDQFLVKDFGIKPESIQINYSGHRGYHLRVKDPRVFSLSSQGRMEIVHYILGMGFDSERVITAIDGSTVIPPRNFPGWAGKISDAMLEFISDIETFPADGRWVKSLKEHQREAAEGLVSEPPILSSRVHGIGLKSWQEISEASVDVYGADTDVPVTHDIRRVIRLIGSLNGKTGFKVVELTRDQLNTFDPFKDAIAFVDGTLKVKVMSGPLPIPKFWIGDTSYGPFLDEEIELTMPAAIFLLCKEVATIA